MRGSDRREPLDVGQTSYNLALPSGGMRGFSRWPPIFGPYIPPEGLARAELPGRGGMLPGFLRVPFAGVRGMADAQTRDTRRRGSGAHRRAARRRRASKDPMNMSTQP